MDVYFAIEVISVVFSLLFLFVLIRENIWCWIFGIVGSGLSIFLFVYSKLYSEAVLYAFYVLIGIYGWYLWLHPKKDAKSVKITQWPWLRTLFYVSATLVAGLLLGFASNKFTDAEAPFVDSQTTVFSVLASVLEAQKVLVSWVVWIAVNGATIGLYWSRGLTVYAALMVIYFVVSVYGLYSWNKRFKLQRS